MKATEKAETLVWAAHAHALKSLWSYSFAVRTELGREVTSAPAALP